MVELWCFWHFHSSIVYVFFGSCWPCRVFFQPCPTYPHVARQNKIKNAKRHCGQVERALLSLAHRPIAVECKFLNLAHSSEKRNDFFFFFSLVEFKFLSLSCYQLFLCFSCVSGSSCGLKVVAMELPQSEQIFFGFFVVLLNESNAHNSIKGKSPVVESTLWLLFGLLLFPGSVDFGEH